MKNQKKSAKPTKDNKEQESSVSETPPKDINACDVETKAKESKAKNIFEEATDEVVKEMANGPCYNL